MVGLGANSKKTLEQDKWLSGKPDADKVPVINSLVPELTLLLEKLHEKTSPESLGVYALKNMIRKNIYSLGLIHRLSEISIRLKDENNILLISDFHKLINEVVKDNEAPFIYERIGTRYKNILIDEFQDTSVMQWSNAIPLIQNALGENNLTLIVGDAKQAIYRWRGGDVSQFIQLPQLAATATPHGSVDFLENHFVESILDINYRSSKEIIGFNNRFYKKLAESLGSFQAVYHDVNQIENRPVQGYVRIDSNEEKEYDTRWEKTSLMILGYVKESIASGYRPKDIAILTRTGAEGGKIGAMLVDNGFQVVTKDSFLINHSPVVRVIMAYFDVLSNPQKKFAPIDLVRSLSEIHPEIHFEEFIKGYTRREGRDIVIDLEKFLDTQFGNRDTLNTTVSVFSQAMMLLRYFRLEADTCMEFLLEKIKERCIQQKMPLTSFLQWWHDQKEKLFTAATPGEQSIQVMTIHKSKGLQFPVVIYPRIKSRDTPNDLWVSTDENIYGLKTALVTSRNTESKSSEGIDWPIEFHEEETRSHLDEVNTCYVATTRAEDRFYLLQESKCDKWLSKELVKVLQSDFEGFSENGFWEAGLKEKSIDREEKNTGEIIRYSGKNYLQPQLRVQAADFQISESQEYGNRLHLCLAEISVSSDVNKAVKKMMTYLGLLDNQLEQNLIADLQKIVLHENISKWFLPGLKIMREREIGIQDGSVLRPDRVVIYEDHVDIIDYKTGLHSEKYEGQLLSYMNVLREIYPLPVRGFLVYTQVPEVVEVNGEW